jgi:TonB family protein
MTRIFAPPTRDSLLYRDSALGSLLLVHLAVLVMLLSPPGGAPPKEQLLERMVVFLVPPESPAPREAASGESGWSAGGSEASSKESSAEAEPAEKSVVAEGRRIPSAGDSAPAVSPALEADEGALTILEVDSAVVRDPSSAAPEYPAHLLKERLEGLAQVRYVVDTLGSVDTLSYRVLQASHPDFAQSVRRALPKMRFRPAMQGGQRVRQLIEQTFRFRINVPVADEHTASSRRVNRGAGIAQTRRLPG